MCPNLHFTNGGFFIQITISCNYMLFMVESVIEVIKSVTYIPREPFKSSIFAT